MRTYGAGTQIWNTKCQSDKITTVAQMPLWPFRNTPGVTKMQQCCKKATLFGPAVPSITDPEASTDPENARKGEQNVNKMCSCESHKDFA
jgi:hypothetical protein